ncbi:MAG: OmpA family protein [Burkholderiaceae bacterium]|jgi:outer membrane protein OmpA-like peptidoglycan-associated protein
MRGHFILVICAAVALSSGCASTTKVVLLPDEAGRVGAVVVKDRGGSQVVDQAFHFTSVKDPDTKPSEVQPQGEDNLKRRYGEVLRGQPGAPVSFFFYFATGSAALAAGSTNQISELIEVIRSRKPTQITIFGHTDSTGTETINERLSADRARAIEQALRSNAPDLGPMRLVFLGDKQPVVPATPDVPQPGNRCVEVLVL